VRAFAASSGEDAGSYRTGAVTRASVQQQLTLTGSVQQVSQSSERFSSAGTLTSVDVSVGDQVQMGDELAQIDPTRLEAAVLRAEASLAQAEATLESDQSSSTSNPTASSTATGPAANTSEKPSPALTAAQKAVDAARRDVAAGLAASAAAMRAQQTACSTLSAGTPTATPTATPSPTGSTSAGESTSTGQESASTSQLTDCINALGLAAESQRKTAADQNALDRALTAWADAIAKASDQPSSSGDSGAPRSSGDSAVSSSDSGQAETSSAARIASGEAAVRAAEAALATAEKDLAAATLTAGISGTVASVPFAIGGMASTSDAIVIVGAGAVDVTVAVPLATVKQIKVGGTAQVTADGATTSTEGVVRAISLLPSADNASSTPTYPVTVRVSAPSAALVSGASATVAIELSRVNNAVTVPNSAVTPVGTAGTSGVVLVWENGVATRTPVVLGAVGLTRTQVVSGLTVGQRVVLADLGQDLPTNQTGPTRGDVFEVGPGGKPGAGFRSRVDQAPR
jgi:HlyD family secretion protein